MTGQPVTANFFDRCPTVGQVLCGATFAKLTEVGWRGANLFGNLAQCIHIETERIAGAEPEHDAGLIDRDVVEGLLQPFMRVRPSAFGMWEVRAPEHVLDSDFVALTHFTTLHIGKAREAVAIDVLAWKHLDLARKCAGAELLGTLLPCPQAIPEPQQLR